MHLAHLLPAAGAVGLAAVLLTPASTQGYGLIGGSLGLDQRDVRVFDNFTDYQANDNAAAHPSFPGYTGAELALWKASVEWGSGLHGDGLGDPHQPGDLGSGNANFDPSWQGNATGIGGPNDNIHSELPGSQSGVLAYCEAPISDGWRIRYYSSWTWDDGPGDPPNGAMDLQGVATHEYGHALGLGHSGTVGATMFPTVSGSGVGQRSIEADDVAGIQALYGAKSSAKPTIQQVAVNPQLGTVTLTGTNFSPYGNEVWFTNGAPTHPVLDPIVRVAGVSSSAGGTAITVSIPSGAGPGDVLVKVAAAGNAALSNAFPLDPSWTGSPFGSPTLFSASPPTVASVVEGPSTVTLSGTGLLGVGEVRFDGAAVDPFDVTQVDDSTLLVDLPLAPSLGNVPIEVESPFGTSNALQLTLVPPPTPALEMDGALLFSETGVLLTAGAPPGHVVYLAGSLERLPTVVPGLLSADIGNQFASLVVLGSVAVPNTGWVQLQVPVSGLPFGTVIHAQAAVFDPLTGSLPLEMSNVASGTYYF